MAKFSILISKTAERQLKSFPAPDQLRISKAILMLAETPLPPGARKLRGYADTFRIRIGVYRVLYSIEGKILTIIILKIGHRKDIYR